MLKLFRVDLVLFAVVLFISFAGIGCQKPCIVDICEPLELKWLVDKTMLENQKLELAWQADLPIKCEEKLDRILLIGSRAYVFTDHNYLFALNRETGNIIFSGPFANADLPVLGLDVYGKQLYSVVGNRLIEMDSDTGVLQSEQSLGYGITCPVSRSGRYFYVGGSDRRIHILDEKNMVQSLEISAYDYSMITSILASGNFIVFGTDSGRVTCMDTGSSPKRIWKFDASDGIVDPLVQNGGNLFIASKDTKVYKLNISKGIYIWKYQTGAVLDTAPVVTNDMVYQYVNSKGLAAIDNKTGSLVWQKPKGLGMLSEVGDKAYILTSDEKMLIMNNEKATQVASLDLAGVTKFVSNTVDSKMYVADEKGRLACIQPIIKSGTRTAALADGK